MPASLADRITRVVLDVHGKLYHRTDGRIGHRMLGAPCLLLHSIGAKTGQPRTNSLTYALDGNAYVVVASAGGAPRNPAWYHNVRANPSVVVQVGTRRLPATASVLLPEDADYGRLWELVNANNKHRYTAYQRNTTRPIPIVVLSPA